MKKLVFEKEIISKKDLELWTTGTYKSRKLRYKHKNGKSGLVHRMWIGSDTVYFIKYHCKNYKIDW